MGIALPQRLGVVTVSLPWWRSCSVIQVKDSSMIYGFFHKGKRRSYKITAASPCSEASSSTNTLLAL